MYAKNIFYSCACVLKYEIYFVKYILSQCNYVYPNTVKLKGSVMFWQLIYMCMRIVLSRTTRATKPFQHKRFPDLL